MANEVWQALIAAVVTIVLAWMQYKTKLAVTKAAEEAAKKVEAVKETLVKTVNNAELATRQTAAEVQDVKETLEAVTDVNLGKINETYKAVVDGNNISDKIHILVNNRMGVALLAVADLAQRLAELTGKREDVTAAKDARQASTEHDKQQAIVDKNAGY